MADNFTNLFNWWIKGLALLCPAFLKKILHSNVNQVVIYIDEKKIVIKHFINGSLNPATNYSFNAENEIDKSTALKFISDQKHNNASIILCLPENIILKKSLTLPAVVKSNVRQTLGFELNRKTPFTVDQVYFDYIAIENNEKLDIELYLAPINKIDPLLKAGLKLGINIDAVSFEEEGKINSDINLTKNNSEKNKSKNNNPFTNLLILTSISLFLAFLYFPLYIQSQNLESLEKDVKKKRHEAIKLQKLAKEKDIIFEQSHFLANKRNEKITSLELINEITHVVPDDTWLNRLAIKSGAIQLQGESTNASSLLQTIESSELFSNAEFRSPITKNNQTNKDRFNLSATIMKKKSS